MLFFTGLFLLLVLAWLRFVAVDQEAKRTVSADGERVYVADGDTLRVGKRTIRLEGMDAVELKQFCREKDGSVWSCGTLARDALQALVNHEGLVCRTSAHDKYARDVARCSVNGVDDIGAIMVEQGWAINEADRDGGYALEEARAKREARGIWRGEFQEPRIWRDTHSHQPKQAN